MKKLKFKRWDELSLDETLARFFGLLFGPFFIGYAIIVLVIIISRWMGCSK